jgi:hypothetical protein
MTKIIESRSRDNLPRQQYDGLLLERGDMSAKAAVGLCRIGGARAGLHEIMPTFWSS